MHTNAMWQLLAHSVGTMCMFTKDVSMHAYQCACFYVYVPISTHRHIGTLAMVVPVLYHLYVGHTASAPEGREGQSQEAQRASS